MGSFVAGLTLVSRVLSEQRSHLPLYAPSFTCKQRAREQDSETRPVKTNRLKAELRKERVLGVGEVAHQPARREGGPTKKRHFLRHKDVGTCAMRKRTSISRTLRVSYTLCRLGFMSLENFRVCAAEKSALQNLPASKHSMLRVWLP